MKMIILTLAVQKSRFLVTYIFFKIKVLLVETPYFKACSGITFEQIGADEWNLQKQLSYMLVIDRS